LLAPCPTPKLENHPFSAARDSLFNIFAATLHICRPFLHPQPEDAPWRGVRKPLITVERMNTTMYHVRDELITFDLAIVVHFVGEYTYTWAVSTEKQHSLNCDETTINRGK
jgi:hypothetical protein